MGDGKGRKPEWVTMKLWGRGGDAILQYQVREGGINNEAPGFKPPAAKPMDVYIRLARKGKTFTTWWKTKEKDEWLEVELTKTLDLKDQLKSVFTQEIVKALEREIFNMNILRI